MSAVISDGPPDVAGEPVYRVEFASRPDRKDDPIEAVITGMISRRWIDDESESWLRLCLEEAVLNAMYHGNEGDPDLPVAVAVYDDGGSWVVTVHDQGDGFSEADIPDVEDEAALLREHGRGLLLMRDWLDRLQYFDGGRTVLMQKTKADHQHDGTPGA